MTDNLQEKIATCNETLNKFQEQLSQDLNEKCESLKCDLKQTLGDKSKNENKTKAKEADDDNGIKFSHRESLMTQLFEDKNIRAIWALCFSILFIGFFQNLLKDYVYENRIVLFDFESLTNFFGCFNKALIFCWVPMMLAALFLVFNGFQLWLKCHRSFPASRSVIGLVFSLIYVAYIAGHVGFSLWMSSHVATGSALFILFEQVRLIMKTFAFVRANVQMVLNYKKNDDEKNDLSLKQDPEFSKYVYFLFAPTLVYRNEYPRNANIRWRFITYQIIDVCLCVLSIYLIHDRVAFPKFASIETEKLDATSMIHLFFFSSIPAVAYTLIAFYGLLHCWQNLWAELLRFGDREFYSDWWNSKSLRSFMLKWNVLVNSWLNEYVYQDLHMITKGKRILSEVIVTLASAIVYDYIISVSFGLFYPVVTIFMGLFGSVVILLPFGHGSFGNILVWFLLIMFNAIHVFLISLEMNIIDSK